MGRSDEDLKSSIQQVLEEDEKVKDQVVRDGNGDDDDDAEANEDLSLKIVERAIMLKGSDAKTVKDGAVKVEMVTTLKDGENVTNLTDDLSQKKVIKKVIKKVVKKVKKAKKDEPMETETDLVSSGKDNGFNTFCRDLFAAEEAKQEGKIVGAKDDAAAAAADIIDNVQMSPVDNHVLQKLLRGPRYFDPPENGWGTCYNCGEEGHMTVNCTSAKRKKPCFVCGSLEHNAKQCSKGQNCFICKKHDHRAKDCPERNEGTQNSKFCLKCGENGHDMLSCRGNYCPDDLKEIQCYVCGEIGHLCCKSYPDTGPREVSCYRCGFSGHTGLACRRSHGETTTGSGSISSCFKCGEEGHFARECSNSKAVKWSNQGLTAKQKSVKSVRRDKSEVTPTGSPNSFGKGRKKRKANYEGSSKSKHKHGWSSEHPGDFHNSHGRSAGGGWVPPTTPPYNNGASWGSSPATPSYYNNGVGGRWGTPSYNDNGVGGRWGTPSYNDNGVGGRWGTPSYNNNNNNSNGIGGGGGWGSPATSYNNKYGASGHAPSTTYPSRYHHHGHGTSGYQHASQYGSNHHSSSGGGLGRHYRWE